MRMTVFMTVIATVCMTVFARRPPRILPFAIVRRVPPAGRHIPYRKERDHETYVVRETVREHGALAARDETRPVRTHAVETAADPYRGVPADGRDRLALVRARGACMSAAPWEPPELLEECLTVREMQIWLRAFEAGRRAQLAEENQRLREALAAGGVPV